MRKLTRSLKRSQIIPNLGIVAAKELIHPSSHVDVVELALSPLTVKELENKHIIMLNKVFQRSEEPRLEALLLRTFLSPDWLGERVNTGKSNQRLFAFEATDITDLRHKLRAEGFPDTVHGHDNRVFGKQSGEAVHFEAVGLNRA